MPVTMSGRLQDITTQPVEEITTATVKAPVYTVGSSGLTTSQPRLLRIGADGSFKVTADEGPGYLYLEGPGWSDSIKFVTVAGLTKFNDAVINAIPVSSAVRDMLREMMRTGDATIRDIKALLSNSVDQMQRGSGERYLTKSDHLDNEKPGTAQVHAGVAAAVGAPDGHQGTVFTSYLVESGRARIQWYIGRDVKGQFHVRYRYYGTNGWGDWQYDARPETFVTERERVIEHGTDWDSLTEGEWRKAAGNNAGDPNSVVNEAGITPVGVLRVMNPGYSETGAKIQMFFAYSGQGVFFRSANARGEWKEWVRLDGGGKGDASHALRHRILEDEFRKRRLGSIGTGGKKAVALRFDHHLIPFRDIILPLLKERGLPWAQVLNPDNMGKNNDAVSASTAQSWALANGGEVWNHGGNHADAKGNSAIDDQVVGSKQRLQAQFPRLIIDSWAPPGLPDGGYDGYFGKTPVESADTYAGQLIWGHHAAVAGYAADNYHPLDRRMRTFLKHRVMDNAKFYHVQLWLNDIPDMHGLVLMLHPNVVGQSKYITVDTLTRVLDELVRRRDAGEIEVVSYSGMFVADAGHAPQKMAGTTPGAVSTSWTQTLSGDAVALTAGVTHELSAWVKTTPGASITCAVTAKAPSGDVTSTRTVTPAGGAGRVSTLVTVPVDATEVTVTMAGAFAHTGIYYRPI